MGNWIRGKVDQRKFLLSWLHLSSSLVMEAFSGNGRMDRFQLDIAPLPEFEKGKRNSKRGRRRLN
jgi:hypothetical protein